MYNQNSEEIQKVISNYFQGIFKGDIDLLESTFDKNALLYGDINGQSYFKTLNNYIEGVRNRKSPSELGEQFNMKIVSIEIFNDIAIAKLNCPMLGFNYIDFLSLNKINDKWLIVNKLFTNNTNV